MSKVIDFNQVKKNYLTIKLNDEQQTTLLVMGPTKRMLNRLIELDESIKNVASDEKSLSSMYECCAELMSRNKGGIKVEAQTLEGLLDVEDVAIFFDAYMEYVAEQVNEKN